MILGKCGDLDGRSILISLGTIAALVSNPDRNPMRQDDLMAESEGQGLLKVLEVLGVVHLSAGA